MKDKTNRSVNQAASLLGKRSAEVRQEKWGKKEFVKRMQEWGKLGGRPKKADKDSKGDEMTYKRGKTYWYEFVWSGRRVRESAKTGNPKVARQWSRQGRRSWPRGKSALRTDRLLQPSKTSPSGSLPGSQRRRPRSRTPSSSTKNASTSCCSSIS